MVQLCQVLQREAHADASPICLLGLFYPQAHSDTEPGSAEEELARQRQQLQQQQAQAKREVRVAMVAMEDAESKYEAQAVQLAATLQVGQL